MRRPRARRPGERARSEIGRSPWDERLLREELGYSLFSCWSAWRARRARSCRILPAQTPVATTDVRNFLQQATQLEGEQRWGEALSIYEKALREHPEDPTLDRRRALAKIHYDLGRRYGDSSFLRAISSLSERDAVSLYSEVLIKIESHYVTSPDWNQLVERGTQSLQTALGEKSFQEKNLRGKSTAEINGYSTQLQRLLQARRVQTRQQAIDLVTAAVAWGRQQLQLAPASITMEYACGAIGAWTRTPPT